MTELSKRVVFTMGGKGGVGKTGGHAQSKPSLKSNCSRSLAVLNSALKRAHLAEW